MAAANEAAPAVEDAVAPPVASTSGRVDAAWHGPVAGALAGLLARVVVFPADTIKARLQVQRSLGGPGAYRGTLDAVVRVARSEGAAGFYRGFPAVALGMVPANMTYFGGYELGKAVVPQTWGVASNMAVGAVAQLLASVIFTPIDIIKERMQVQAIMGHAYRYEGSGQALRVLLADQGLRGLLRGYVATNAVWLPWNMVHISVYEYLKRLAAAAFADAETADEVGDDAPGAAASSRTVAQAEATAAAAALEPLAVPGASSADDAPSRLKTTAPVQTAAAVAAPADSAPTAALPSWAVAACSAGSSAVAAVVTHPVDVVKTRLQVLTASKEGAGLTALQVARQLMAREGLRGFGQGMAARIATIAPGAALSWSLYEAIKAWLP